LNPDWKVPLWILAGGFPFPATSTSRRAAVALFLRRTGEKTWVCARARARQHARGASCGRPLRGCRRMHPVHDPRC
jgi:hypothetical protein